MRDSNADALKRALFAVKDMRAKLEALEAAKKEPIAIIGAGYRLPGGVRDAASFWQVLRAGVDTVAEIPRERWDLNAYYDPDPEAPGKMYTRAGAFVTNIDKFDPQFFGMSPREAASLDPQQRLLLEVAWEAFENAGYAADALAGSQTGVFVGFSCNDFAHYLRRVHGTSAIDPYSGTGGAACVAAGRISYVLGLHGPNFAVDTACSSSLVAIHSACENLRSGKADLALAGGVNLLLIPDPFVYFSRMRAISRDGRCRTFDAAAEGYGRGEGCALIVLKRLSDAVRDRDNILALIRGTAINHDGRSSGLTVPNGLAQQAVMRAALADGGINPLHVSYLEAHGTGTPLGDPIEIRAAAAVLCADRSSALPLFVGSAKTNFAHLEAAAGIAGLLKVVLALQHREVPPHLHFNNPTPHIPWNELPLAVPTRVTPWESENGERFAGVSSFGFSGTNAHIVLSEFVDQLPVASGQLPVSSNQSSLNADHWPLTTDNYSLITFSAKNENALRELARSYEQHLALHEELVLADIAFTANTGRAHFSHRLAVLADSTAHLREQLAAFAARQAAPNIFSGYHAEAERPKIAFLFTGQGAQYLNMGKGLYETQPVFRAALEKCAALLRPHLEVPLLSVLFNDNVAPPSKSVILPHERDLALGTAPSTREVSSRMTMEGEVIGDQYAVISNQLLTTDHWSPNTGHLLHQTAYTQPALFAIEYALAELWKSWGVQPNVVMGHSIGEYVAACVAGMFSLEDGLKLIAARGRLMQALPANGAMVAVFAGEERVAPILEPFRDRVVIAAYNGPQNLVLSGEKEALTRIVQQLETQGLKTKPLTVSHAFHSPLMEPMLDAFEQVVSEIKFTKPRIPIISNLTGRRLKIEDGRGSIDDHDSQASILEPRSYFRRHAREAVRFSTSMQALHEQGCNIFLEVGPHPTLLGMGRECLPEAENLAWVPSLRKGQNDMIELQKSVAALYVRGLAFDWQKLAPTRGRRIPLPTYPFQRERHWIEDQRTEQEEQGLLATPDTEPQGRFDGLYEIAWRPQALQMKTPTETASKGLWLIFSDEYGLGAALQTLLEARGEQCITVFPGQDYKTTGLHFEIAPSCAAHYRQLLQHAATHDLPLHGIVHLWSLHTTHSAQDFAKRFETDQALACRSLLHLVQSLTKHGHAVAPRLFIITQGAQPVENSIKAHALPQAGIWGIAGTVAREHPELRCLRIDLDDEIEAHAHAQRLFAELYADETESITAWRGEQRYVARLMKLDDRELMSEDRGSKRAEDRTRFSILDPRSSYLITGGTRGLGLLIAEWLCEHGARHLVLLGRNQPGAAEQARIDQLNANGAQVYVAQADVADGRALATVFEKVTASMPALRGVLHAAGVLDDGMLMNQDWPRFAKVMAPKALGAWHLHTLTENLKLDFFVMFSSMSALLCPPGQANYAAANVFLDTLAHYRRACGLPALSINWGPWAETGMAARLNAERKQNLSSSGVQPLSPTQGLHVLAELLPYAAPQVAVFPVDWSQFARQFAHEAPPALLRELIEAAPFIEEEKRPSADWLQLLQRMDATLAGDRQALVIDYVRAQFCQIMGLSPQATIEPKKGFFEMGMDSFMAVELKNLLTEKIGAPMPRTLAFEYPSLHAISTYLMENVLTRNGHAERKTQTRPGREAVEVTNLEQLSQAELLTAFDDQLKTLDAMLESN